MLTVKIITNEELELIFEALECNIQRGHVKSYDEWVKFPYDNRHGTFSPINPNEDVPIAINPNAGRIAFIELNLKNGDGEWCSHYIVNSSLYIMNENGQTISTYFK